MFGDKDFTIYFGLVYNDIGNLTMAIIYLKSMMIIIDIQNNVPTSEPPVTDCSH